MIILTDCLNAVGDEGATKLTQEIVKRIKNTDKSVKCVSYSLDGKGEADVCADKFFLTGKLKHIIKKGEEILFIPRSSDTIGGAIKAFFLRKRFSAKIKFLVTINRKIGFLEKFFLLRSASEIITVAEDTERYLKRRLKNKVVKLNAAVDTAKFSPVSISDKNKLKNRFGFSENDKVVLHVGHVKTGRNADKLLLLTDKYKVLFVASGFDKHDNEIVAKFKNNPSAVFISEYIEDVENVYRAADVYLFPVEEAGNCIDIPLSVLEAASCGVPVVCTRYGELASLEGEKGFFFIDSINKEQLCRQVDKAINSGEDGRDTAMRYDFCNINKIL